MIAFRDDSPRLGPGSAWMIGERARVIACGLLLTWGVPVLPVLSGDPLRWDEGSLPRFGALQADFTARNGRGQEWRGEWALRLRPVFAQRIALKEFASGRFVREQAASFDGSTGEAREYTRSAGTLRGRAAIALNPPALLGYSELPSNPSLFFGGMWPLADFFELCRAEVRRLEGPEEQLAVFCRYPESGPFLLVYLFRRSLPGVVAEERIYETRANALAREVSPSRAEEDLAAPMPLPAGFGPGSLFIVKTVLETRRIGDTVVPVKWQVRPALGSEESDVTISLVPETVRIDQEDASYRVEFPPGTRVRDFVEGKDYFAGRNGREYTGEVVTGAVLSEVLRELGAEEAKDEPRDADHVTSCAANALYVLLALSGKAASFAEVARRLGVKEPGSFQSLAQLREAARSFGIAPALAVRGAQDIVYREGARRAVAHIVRRSKGGKERPHYVVVDDYDHASDTVRVTDIPRLPYRVKREQFREVWKGYALVAGRAAEEAIAAAAFRRRALWGTGAALVGLAAGVALLGRGRWRRFRLLGSLSVLLCPWVLSACEGASGENGSPGARVLVVGPAAVDLGRVRWRRGEAAGHTFRLRNVSPRPVAIGDIKTSCSCLAARASTRRLEPGGEAEVELKLKSGLVSGPQEAWGLVTFEEAQPVVLRVKAVVERDYKVLVIPGRWMVSPAEKSAGMVVGAFRVREFCDWDTSGSETEVSVSGEGVSLERVGPWRPVGERLYGFARETEITLRYRLPEARFFEETIRVHFRCRTPRGGDERPEVREDERSLAVQG